jgi:hypothetical protein
VGWSSTRAPYSATACISGTSSFTTLTSGGVITVAFGLTRTCSTWSTVVRASPSRSICPDASRLIGPAAGSQNV